MTEVIFLGVGGAFAADPAGNHTALLVRSSDATILLDCGPGIMRQLEMVGVRSIDLTHVIISHVHGDHSLGLPMLLLERTIFWPDHPLLVLAAAPLLKPLRRLSSLAYPDLARRTARVARFVPLEEGPVARPLPAAASIQYMLAPGKHSVPVWGLRLIFPSGRSLVYSSDTGPSSDIGRLASGADLLAHDSYYVTGATDRWDNHSAATAVGELAAQAGVRTVALLHRADTTAAAAAEYVANAAQHFTGRILAPGAGERIEL